MRNYPIEMHPTLFYVHLWHPSTTKIHSTKSKPVTTMTRPSTHLDLQTFFKYIFFASDRADILTTRGHGDLSVGTYYRTQVAPNIKHGGDRLPTKKQFFCCFVHSVPSKLMWKLYKLYENKLFVHVKIFVRQVRQDNLVY